MFGGIALPGRKLGCLVLEIYNRVSLFIISNSIMNMPVGSYFIFPMDEANSTASAIVVPALSLTGKFERLNIGLKLNIPDTLHIISRKPRKLFRIISHTSLSAMLHQPLP